VEVFGEGLDTAKGVVLEPVTMGEEPNGKKNVNLPISESKSKS
jgi:hypothetical protein